MSPTMGGKMITKKMIWDYFSCATEVTRGCKGLKIFKNWGDAKAGCSIYFMNGPKRAREYSSSFVNTLVHLQIGTKL